VSGVRSPLFGKRTEVLLCCVACSFQEEPIALAPSIHIICFGNLLSGDDGFGIHVYHRLLLETFPTEVKIFDAGLMGLSALSLFDDCDVAVVIDAVLSQGDIGHVHTLPLSAFRSPVDAFSAHALDLHHLFHLLPVLHDGTPPKTLVIGAEIEPPSGTFSMALSVKLVPAVEAAVVEIKKVLQEYLPACL